MHMRKCLCRQKQLHVAACKMQNGLVVLETWSKHVLDTCCNNPGLACLSRKAFARQRHALIRTHDTIPMAGTPDLCLISRRT